MHLEQHSLNSVCLSAVAAAAVAASTTAEENRCVVDGGFVVLPGAYTAKTGYFVPNDVNLHRHMAMHSRFCVPSSAAPPSSLELLAIAPQPCLVE